MRILLCAVGAIVASVLTACGSGSSSTTPANVRLVNLTGATVSLSLSSTFGLSGIGSDQASAYEQITPAVYLVSVSSVDPSVEGAPAIGWPFGTAETYSVIAYQAGNQVYGFPLTDNMTAPAGNFFTLDVANVAPDAGPLDVYLLPPGVTSIPSQTRPTFSSVQSLVPTGPATPIAGSFNIIVTAASKANDVRLSLIGSDGAGAVAFSESQVATLAFTETTGGLLVNAYVITQGGGITSYPATQARVRVLPAVPTATAVGVTVGTTALPTTYGGQPTPYTLVTAGASATLTSVTISGTQISPTAPLPPVPTTALVVGQDYTILVYGDGVTAAGTTAALLDDNNFVIPNYASVRMINGAVTTAIAPGGLNLSVNNSLVTTGVAYGTSSGYTGVTPGPSASVTVIGGTYDWSVTPPTNLITGDVYTVFVYNSTVAPLVIEDR